MAAEYKIRVYDRSGVLKHELIDYRAVAYTKIVNAPGMGIVTLDGSHPVTGEIDLDWLVEVHRRDLVRALDWYCDFTGFFRDALETADEQGVRSATLYCPGVLSLLERPVIAYKASTSNRTSFASAKAETILKTLVTYNATPAGTIGDGRMRDVTLPTITVQTDGAGGNTLDLNCAWDNLLNTLQGVALVGGGDFDLVRSGASSWQFQWFAGQRGTDRSATVVFSLQYGNMTNPSLRLNFLGERTVAIVGGQGEDIVREVVVRNGVNYAAPHNATEMFVDARQMTTAAGLNAAGDAHLAERQAKRDFTFEVLQTPSTVYGRDYFLGDLVTATFGLYSDVKKVQQVAVEFGLNGERINVVMADE
jgi:hypothetical protein